MANRTCSKCGKNHSVAFHLEQHLNDKGFPVHAKGYKSAHEHANKVEKKQDPKAYARMHNVDKKLKKHELAGKNTKSGEILISKKVPKDDRKNTVTHEVAENIRLRPQNKAKFEKK